MLDLKESGIDKLRASGAQTKIDLYVYYTLHKIVKAPNIYQKSELETKNNTRAAGTVS